MGVSLKWELFLFAITVLNKFVKFPIFNFWSEDSWVEGHGDGRGNDYSSTCQLNCITGKENTFLVFDDGVLDGFGSLILANTAGVGSRWGHQRGFSVRSQTFRIIVDAVVIFDSHLIGAFAEGANFQIGCVGRRVLTVFGGNNLPKQGQGFVLCFCRLFLCGRAIGISEFRKFGDLALVARHDGVLFILVILSHLGSVF